MNRHPVINMINLWLSESVYMVKVKVTGAEVYKD